MNIWHDINESEITPELFTAVIEIPKNSQCKYELDKETGLLKLDRVLYTSLTIPPTTDLFQGLTPTTRTPLMFWCFAHLRSIL